MKLQLSRSNWTIWFFSQEFTYFFFFTKKQQHTHKKTEGLQLSRQHMEWILPKSTNGYIYSAHVLLVVNFSMHILCFNLSDTPLKIIIIHIIIIIIIIESKGHKQLSGSLWYINTSPSSSMWYRIIGQIVLCIVPLTCYSVVGLTLPAPPPMMRSPAFMWTH